MQQKTASDEVNSTLAGERKAIYHQNDDGGVSLIPSHGNKIEETVTTQALDEFKRQSAECRQRVNAGISSTLEFHMYDNRMDLTTLAQSMGIFRWRVTRHLRPEIFCHLKQSMLNRYAEALGISTKELTSLPPTAENN